MSNIELVKEALSQIEQGKIMEAGKCFSDHFSFEGPSLIVLNKPQYLEAHEALVKAIPDWKFNASDWREEGDTVKAKMHITGTHTHTLHYPFLSVFRDEPPTHKHISLPEEPTRFTVENGKITSIEADKVPGGGIMGVLEQLGIRSKVPVAI